MSDPVTPEGADVDIYGDQNLTFGLPAAVKTLVPGMAITELNDDDEPQFTAEAQGQDAAVAAVAVAKKKKFSGNGTGFLLDKEDWEAVKHFVFEEKTYIVLKKGRAFKFNEFLKCNFTYIGYEGVSVPA